VGGKVQVIDVGPVGHGAATEVAGGRHRLVDVVHELPDQRGGLLGEGLAVLDGEPATPGGVQDGLGDDVRGEVP